MNKVVMWMEGHLFFRHHFGDQIVKAFGWMEFVYISLIICGPFPRIIKCITLYLYLLISLCYLNNFFNENSGQRWTSERDWSPRVHYSTKFHTSQWSTLTNLNLIELIYLRVFFFSFQEIFWPVRLKINPSRIWALFKDLLLANWLVHAQDGDRTRDTCLSDLVIYLRFRNEVWIHWSTIEADSVYKL